MLADGSIEYLYKNDLQYSDVNSIRLLKNNIALEKLFSLINNDIPGAARKFVFHLYSKIMMSNLYQQKFLPILILHTMVHRKYNPDNNGLYPVLKPDGTPLNIKISDPFSIPQENKKKFPVIRWKNSFAAN